MVRTSCFVDLEKAHDRMLSKEPWFCMRESGVAEKYVALGQDIYETSMSVKRRALRVTDGFEVEVGQYQGLGLSPFLFIMGMDGLTAEVRQEFPWMMLFEDDSVIFSERRKGVEEKLVRWRYVLEKKME